MNYDIAGLLFKTRKREIRIAGTNVNVNGSKGLICSFRPTSAASASAKYSTVGLVLDKIILDHAVIGMESPSQVYVKFENDGVEYAAVFDGEKIDWVTQEPTERYLILIPAVVYTLSSLFRGEEAEELKGYFNDVKAEKDPKAVLLFCDAFYYAFAKKDEWQVLDSNAKNMPVETVQRGIDTGLFREIDALSGLSDKAGKTEPVETVNAPKAEEAPDYVVHYDGWSDDQRKNIPSPSTLDTFVMTDTATSIARKIKYRMDKVLKRLGEGMEGVEAIGPDYINLLMVGRPATGKTALANAVAAMTQMPIYTVPFSKHTEEDTVEGKNKVVDGKIGFVETEFLKAYEHGGIIVCEEINLADPGVVMGSMGQAIEKPFIVMKDGYQPVRRHPLCVIIATMNTGTAGSKQLNQALSSRFKCTYTLDDPSRNTFIEILAAQGYNKRNCRYVYDAYTKIINYLKDPHTSQEELCNNITLRGCFGALECIEEGQSAKEALNNSLVGKIAEVDLEVAKQVREAVIESLPDKTF